MSTVPTAQQINAVCDALQTRLFGEGATPDLYTRLNEARAWFNQQGVGFDWYLEDEWNDPVEGETRIEYRVRSLRTLDDFGALAYDRYLNHRSERGVWSLGEYQDTHGLVESVEPLRRWMLADSEIER